MRKLDERTRLFLRKQTTERESPYREGGTPKQNGRRAAPVTLPRLTCLEKPYGDDEEGDPGSRR